MTPDQRASTLATILTDRFGETVPLERIASDDSLDRLRDRLGAAPAAVVAFDTDDRSDARRRLEAAGLHVDFVGEIGGGDRRVLAVTCGERVPPPETPPASFRALAIVIAYNEADIIASSVQYLLDQGVEVHLVDNWSTDGTAAAVEHLAGRGLTIERFPADKAPEHYDWAALLSRAEEIAAASGADWCVLHDADERRFGPWSDRNLREALFEVDRRGYNAVNHTIIEFHPVDNRFVPGTDVEQALEYWSPPRIGANRTQLKAWKNTGVRVDLHSSGGHDVQFPDRRVFPYNFLLKHYPVRSQAHGEQKVLHDRKPRWNTTERKRQWHRHYDHVREGHNFLKDPASLTRFDPDTFPTTRLVERLCGGDLVEAPPGRGHGPAATLLRITGLRGPAVALRRWYWIARRRDIESGQR